MQSNFDFLLCAMLLCVDAGIKGISLGKESRAVELKLYWSNDTLEGGLPNLDMCS
ncbi:hypothetical protein BofuT4_uP141090.1 [Botrytis cinerea T4]|uniref:Uncharacterized protein n=1 Tax=Botryotinia fuckeliana (strain T4) TaxID=999810 RepID=G2YYZ9_BOTF4|nr:hypothetical protein BofuT4_uP141090.1 [Botrytis cinerea T4]